MTGVDYQVTRKFLLSVLWRAHVCSSPVLSAVKLGTHADRIRGILQGEQDESAGDRYPMFCYALRNDRGAGGLAKRLVLTPVRKRTQGQWNYEVAFLGCLWKIFVASHPPGLPQSCRLKKDGTIVMPVVSVNEVPAIRSLLRQHPV